MFSWQQELAIIKAAIPEWEPWLFSTEIYWPLHFDRTNPLLTQRIPRLSAGRILLSLKLLKGFELEDPEISKSIFETREKIHELIKDWRANWGKKVDKEINARLRQWQQILNDLHDKSSFSQSYFAENIRIRLILDLLMDEMPGETGTYLSSLKNLDQVLRMNTRSSDFVWSEKLKIAFPKTEYWYLYRQIGNKGD